MKNTAINTLGYTGIVTLSQYIGNKKIKIAQMHNSGGNPLFNFLSDCLVGDFDVAALSRPTKIMLLKGSEEKDDTNGTVSMRYEKASTFMFLRTKPEKVYNKSKGIVRYSFQVSKDFLANNTFNYIGLYNNSASEQDLDKFAAICPVDLPTSTLSSSAILIVDWELIISNIPNVSNTNQNS